MRSGKEGVIAIDRALKIGKFLTSFLVNPYKNRASPAYREAPLEKNSEDSQSSFFEFLTDFMDEP
jgi:hypothetical protein